MTKEPTLEISETKVPVIGDFKPKTRFIEFLSVRGSVNFITNKATIEGSKLAGLGLEGVVFKLTICDEGTISFEEVGTSLTDKDQRQRLVEVIEERISSLALTRNHKMVVSDLVFKTVEGDFKEVLDCYLSIEYIKPYDKLQSIFEDVTEVTISEKQSSTLDDILGMLDDSPEEETSEDVQNEQQMERNEDSSSIDPFTKMKEEKIIELEGRIEHSIKEVSRLEWEKSQADKKLESAKEDLRILKSRVDSLKPPKAFNGYFFFISEEKNQSIQLDEATQNLIYEKVLKIKSLNTKAFMDLFLDGEYHIRLAKKTEEGFEDVFDYSTIPEEIVKSISSEITLVVEEIEGSKVLLYRGDLKWHALNAIFLKEGFEQNAEFNKHCGSNSYFRDQKNKD